MEIVSQIKKLDTLLSLFKEEQVEISLLYIKEMMLGKGVNVSDAEISRYITQLLSDKYIVWGDEGYLIRIEGLLAETYEQKMANRRTENIRLANLENELKENRKWTLYLTILIAAGTLVASIYYLYLLIQSLCDCEFWFRK